jgi:hypothetical protein
VTEDLKFFELGVGELVAEDLKGVVVKVTIK